MATEGPIVVSTTTSVEKVVREDGTKLINQFEMIKPLGKGAFGKVKLCKDTKDGKLYAIKIMDKMMLKKKRQGMSNLLENVKKEIAIMKKISHPNCVNLYEVIDDPNSMKLYIRLEFVEGGQCMEAQNGVPPLPLEKAKSYFIDLISGLEYLHFNQILHRDLKPENLLVTKEGVLKLADFGVSQILDSNDGTDVVSKSAGTPAFMAPECCAPGAFHGKLADIWAAGVSLYFMVHGKCPFIHNNIIKLYEIIQEQPIEYDETLPADLVDLLKHILDKDPSQRYTIEDIKQHPWFLSGHPATDKPTVPISVTSEEVKNAFTLSDSVVLIVKVSLKMKKRLEAARRTIEARRNSEEAVDSPSGASPKLVTALPEGYEVLGDSDDEGDGDKDKPEGDKDKPEGKEKENKKKGRCTQQ